MLKVLEPSERGDLRADEPIVEGTVTRDRVQSLITRGDLHLLNTYITSATLPRSGITLAPDAVALICDECEKALGELKRSRPVLSALNRTLSRRAVLGFAAAAPLGIPLARAIPQNDPDLPLVKPSHPGAVLAASIIDAGLLGILLASLPDGEKRNSLMWRLRDLKELTQAPDKLGSRETTAGR